MTEYGTELREACNVAWLKTLREFPACSFGPEHEKPLRLLFRMAFIEGVAFGQVSTHKASMAAIDRACGK